MSEGHVGGESGRELVGREQVAPPDHLGREADVGGDLVEHAFTNERLCFPGAPVRHVGGLVGGDDLHVELEVANRYAPGNSTRTIVGKIVGGNVVSWYAP